MPSIYNHENACWGIRRSSSDMFQYDFNEEFQTNKVREFGCPSNQNTATTNTTYVHYSVSSNGYYGYQPHKVAQIESSDEIEMDVEDINATASFPSTNDNTNTLDCVAFSQDLQHHNVRRKRQLPSESLESNKRIRQDEAEYLMKNPIQESQQCGGGTSLRRRRLRNSKVDLSDYESITTQLLKQTHGCETYLFERTCDY